MARLFYGHILSNNVKIHYYRTGDEKPPVILLHGFAENGLCWGTLGLHLEPDYDVVMVDARGHGLSSEPESGYDAFTQAEDVANLILELQLYKPAVIGHAMGAETAAILAAEHPELVQCVVLEDPCWQASENHVSAEYLSGLAGSVSQKIQEDHSKTLDALIQECSRNNPSWARSEYFQWAKARLQVKTGAAMYYQEGAVEWRSLVKRITCPVLLITADTEAGAVVTSEVAKEASKTWKKNSVIQISGAGHHIHREQYDLYWDAVAHFLARVRKK